MASERENVNNIPITQKNPLSDFSGQNIAIYSELRKWIQPNKNKLRKSKSHYLQHLKNTSRHYEKQIDKLLLKVNIEDKKTGAEPSYESMINQMHLNYGERIKQGVIPFT